MKIEKIDAPKYIKKMIKEDRKLNDKIDSLSLFIKEQDTGIAKPEVTLDQLDLLKDQFEAMNEYSDILHRRISTDLTDFVEKNTKVGPTIVATKIDLIKMTAEHYELGDISKEQMAGFMLEMFNEKQ